MINFIQETGTAANNSTSYASIFQFKQYWEDRGVVISDADTLIQGWLNQATEFIDNKYQFMGCVVKTDQALSWPRSFMIKRNFVYVDSDIIPVELINAVCYLAAEAKKGNLNRVDEGISSYSYGVVSKTFKDSSDSIDYPAVEKYLKSFIISGVQMVRVN